MKINKIIIRIAHFFGLMKNIEHMDDIIVNISTISTYDYIHYDKKLDTVKKEKIINDIKEKIYQEFRNDIKLERRCRNVGQVWITFYKDEIEKKHGGSIVKTLPYRKGVLFYPYYEIKKNNI